MKVALASKHPAMAFSLATGIVAYGVEDEDSLAHLLSHYHNSMQLSRHKKSRKIVREKSVLNTASPDELLRLINLILIFKY